VKISQSLYMRLAPALGGRIEPEEVETEILSGIVPTARLFYPLVALSNATDAQTESFMALRTLNNGNSVAGGTVTLATLGVGFWRVHFTHAKMMGGTVAATNADAYMTFNHPGGNAHYFGAIFAGADGANSQGFIDLYVSASGGTLTHTDGGTSATNTSQSKVSLLVLKLL